MVPGEVSTIQNWNVLRGHPLIQERQMKMTTFAFSSLSIFITLWFGVTPPPYQGKEGTDPPPPTTTLILHQCFALTLLCNMHVIFIVLFYYYF